MRFVLIVQEAYVILYKQLLQRMDAWYEEPVRAPPRLDIQKTLSLTYEPLADEWKATGTAAVESEAEVVTDEWAGTNSEFADA